MLYYFLTIDRSDTSEEPVKKDYRDIIHKWEEAGIIIRGTYPVECYENKIKKVTGEEILWLHYHAIVKAKKMIIFKNMQVKGYSIKFKYLKTKEDIFNTAGYINKDKIDKALLPGYIDK